MPACLHDRLVLDVTEYGTHSGFKRASSRQLTATAGPQGTKSVSNGSFDYAAPLILPHDALSDPEENEPQSYDEYYTSEDRNKVTPNRNTIYLVPPPVVDKSVSFMSSWTTPCNTVSDAAPDMSSLVKDYLAAFYHGMPVKLDDRPTKFTRHGERTNKKPGRVDLAFGDSMLMDIRTRESPSRDFPRQLNLNDLIDALIYMLPDDAYCIMLLTNHDIWEDDDDLFTCGRAYGASRVAVVSTARYNPVLDPVANVDVHHAWPASHCRAYVDLLVARYEDEYGRIPRRRRKKDSKQEDRLSEQTTGMRAAVQAYITDRSPAATSDPWLARVCKTVSHELGHCIGIDHCCYYACLMQSTSGLLEDARQPPYLCPVDEAKLLNTTGSTSAQRDEAMLSLLQSPAWTVEPMFLAFRAWLGVKMTAHS